MDATAARAEGGRVNQKKRTRDAIVRAAAELMLADGELSMPAIAAAALVSEATAYRHFPDLAGLLREAMNDQLPDPATALAAVADSPDPVERAGYAAEFLARHVLARQSAVRTMIAATIAKPGATAMRPGLRVGLIDYALAPVTDRLAAADPERLARLKQGLSVVISAEAVLSLLDLSGLCAEEAVASVAHTAKLLTSAAMSEAGGAQE
ncbi:TetR/AcrR family transcriptional regulator [Actinospica robiniae]|uniref:TetR/AcrR family transcriptional regulator n=1 Tax=Actinospica robiniae TaxID=304901 RepID=UPI0004268DC8|nr:TetR/AcrR family transcriptional regulator [Actinospica robiniae]